MWFCTCQKIAWLNCENEKTTSNNFSVSLLLSSINPKDNSLDISFEEWRDYLLFHPSAELHDIITHWRHNSVSLFFHYTYTRTLIIAPLAHIHTGHFCTQYCEKKMLRFLTILSKTFRFVNQGKLWTKCYPINWNLCLKITNIF